MPRTKRAPGPFHARTQQLGREVIAQRLEAGQPVFGGIITELEFPEYKRLSPLQIRDWAKSQKTSLPPDLLGDFPDNDAPSEKPERWKRMSDDERRTWVNAQLTPLPTGDDANDFPFSIEDLANNAFPATSADFDKEAFIDVNGGLGKIVRQYQMYINKPTKKIMVLQYPNRDPSQPYSDKTGQKPLELRIKPGCGLVEVDIPMDVHQNFDKEKGILYGEAMRKSRVLQEGGSYGLAGGFGSGPKPRPAAGGNPAASSEEPIHEILLENFEDANNKGHVMNKITLGGQIIPYKDTDPTYMIGAFRGNSVYLNKVDAIVQLRPQFFHIDALNELERPNRPQRATENTAEESEAKAVNMSVKSTEAEDTDMYGGASETAKLLKAIREEPWQRLTWIDQEDQRSYEAYEELFIPPNATIPTLVSSMTSEQYLDAISCPRIDPTNPGKRVMGIPKQYNDPSTEEEEDAESEYEEDLESEDEDGGPAAHSGDEGDEEGDQEGDEDGDEVGDEGPEPSFDNGGDE